MNFQILIKKHCIIGFIVEPFDMYPILASIPTVVANKGCMTDEYFNHNKLSEEKRDLEPQQLGQLASKEPYLWPKDQTFHINIVESTLTKIYDHFEKFVNVLKSAIIEFVSGMKLKFRFPSSF